VAARDAGRMTAEPAARDHLIDPFRVLALV
jgi:hypothetical protein